MAMMVLDEDLQERLKAERAESGGDRFDEVWEGVYMMAPLANNEHGILQAGLVWAIRNALGQEAMDAVQPGANVSDREDDWEHNYRCPDVVVALPGTTARNCGTHWFGGPDLLVEIVSRGDRSRDKFDFYSTIGVRELMIVDRWPWALELYRLTGNVLELVGRTEVDAPNELRSEVVPLTFKLTTGTPRPRIIAAHPDGIQRWVI